MSRLKENIVKIGMIGKTKDGAVTRLGFSKEYFEAAKKTKELMEDAGLKAAIDSVGNVRGMREGTKQPKRVIAVGSHLDSVQNGGIFDGITGVMAGIECAYRLKENHIANRHAIEIIGFNAEEASQSWGGLFGSSAMMGLIDTADKSLLEKVGLLGVTRDDILLAKTDKKDYRCYLEMHIEQGDRLFSEKKDVGIVTGIVGIMRYRITARGESNHAGTTRMETRRDALVGMSQLIVTINSLARGYDGDLVATIGTLTIIPGSINTIPGLVEGVLELRSMDPKTYLGFLDDVFRFAKSIPGINFTFEKISEKEHIQCDGEIMDCLEDVCGKRKLSYLRMPSGAGHDAKALAKNMPIGMIFVPSIHGISHSKDERTDWESIDLGMDVLYETLLRLDEGRE